MSSTSTTKAPTHTPTLSNPALAARIVKEGYGPGAWHGPDLQTALADVTPQQAFWRPGPGRHNIAEIAIHHAWYVRSVVEKLSGDPGEPFPLEGSDWLELSDEQVIPWREIMRIVDGEHGRLATIVSGAGGSSNRSTLAEAEQFDLILGITCHAIYHAGQVQLIKRLGAM